MKIRTLGISLIVIGVVMMIYTGFNYTTSKKIVDLGPLQINQEKKHAVKWPSILGGVLVVGGILVVIFSRRSDT